jgi:hypothetical protein
MPRPGAAPAPFTPPVVGDDKADRAMVAVAMAINQKADRTTIPTFSAIHLISPNGGVWMVSVNDAGAMHIEQMP